MPFKLYIYLRAFVTYSDPIHDSSIVPIFLPNLMFDHLLELSYQDDSDEWSNIGFGEEITRKE